MRDLDDNLESRKKPRLIAVDNKGSGNRSEVVPRLMPKKKIIGSDKFKPHHDSFDDLTALMSSMGLEGRATTGSPKPNYKIGDYPSILFSSSKPSVKFECPQKQA